ncbi:uncharacterized protein LOC128737972 [Sabethes cyaneus]|uniref:uncharacterized protein LOC128737972 n=1 Tax=Sabethes cyaneus TaxID=53552 RepID=UPI00237D418A|nr:uncharacterized protein LOC128737972 [Sabethes cyaneus]
MIQLVFILLNLTVGMVVNREVAQTGHGISNSSEQHISTLPSIKGEEDAQTTYGDFDSEEQDISTSIHTGSDLFDSSEEDTSTLPSTTGMEATTHNHPDEEVPLNCGRIPVCGNVCCKPGNFGH